MRGYLNVRHKPISFFNSLSYRYNKAQKYQSMLWSIFWYSFFDELRLLLTKTTEQAQKYKEENMPNMNTHFQVTNINGTSKNTCRCASWLKHWRRFTRGRRTTCSVLGCTRRDLVGGHVKISDQRHNRSWWIVPICRDHNNTWNTTDMFIDSRTSLAPANVSETCG